MRQVEAIELFVCNPSELSVRVMFDAQFGDGCACSHDGRHGRYEDGISSQLLTFLESISLNIVTRVGITRHILLLI